MAADGAATLGSSIHATAQQRYIKKLTIHGGKVVIGTAGPVGMGQAVRAELEEPFRTNKFTGQVERVAGQVRGLMWPIVQREVRAVADVRAASPDAAARVDPFLQTLIAFPLGDDTCLVQFNEACAFTIANDELPFVCLGSGQSIADHFLAFVRRVLWCDDSPTLALGITSAIWTMRHVIETNAFGIQDPTQVVTLTRGHGELVARELTSPELSEHDASVDSIEATVGKWGAQFSLSPIIPAPVPPPS